MNVKRFIVLSKVVVHVRDLKRLEVNVTKLLLHLLGEVVFIVFTAYGVVTAYGQILYEEHVQAGVGEQSILEELQRVDVFGAVEAQVKEHCTLVLPMLEEVRPEAGQPVDATIDHRDE